MTTKPEGPAPERCADCDECARMAYSDATTPGFFYDKCAKHRLPATPAPSQRSKQVPERTISDECKYCAEGEPEWSTDASCWIHRRPQLDKRCTRKTLSPIGELPAPGQPAAREWLPKQPIINYLLEMYNGRFAKDIVAAMEGYARQQTAAKDAEIARLNERWDKAARNIVCAYCGTDTPVDIRDQEARLNAMLAHSEVCEKSPVKQMLDAMERAEAAERERDSLRERMDAKEILWLKTVEALEAVERENAALRLGSRTAEQYRAALIIAAQKRLAAITQCPNCNSGDRAKDVTGSHHDSSGMDIHLDRCEHPWHAVRYEDDSYEMLSMGLPNYPQFDKGWVKEMQKAAFQYELAALKAGKEGQK